MGNSTSATRPATAVARSRAIALVRMPLRAWRAAAWRLRGRGGPARQLTLRAGGDPGRTMPAILPERGPGGHSPGAPFPLGALGAGPRRHPVGGVASGRGDVRCLLRCHGISDILVV